jgi:hypothetical protein
MPNWQLDRFVVKAEPNTDYTLVELDGVTAKTLYTGADGLTVASGNTIRTNSFGTAEAYFRGDAQLRRGTVLVRDRIRQGWEFLDPTDPPYGGASVRASQLLVPAELAEVQDTVNAPTIDLAPKIQAWLDAALGLYGDGLSGKGGRGCRIYFDAGTWLFSHLDLRPGVQMIGCSSRYEVQFTQTEDYNEDHFITILGHQDNSDVVQRRTEVYISDIGFQANGLLDSLSEPLDCMHSIPEVFDDNTDPDDEVTRTGVIGYRFSCEGSSGWGYYSKKRGKNWLHECQFARNGKAGYESVGNGGGGLFVQGPDSRFDKVYCGSNHGWQMHIKSSATPVVIDVELGVTKSDPTQYGSMYVEQCTTFFAAGGNCAGPWLIEGGENDTTANEYGVPCWWTVYGVEFTFANKAFIDSDTDTLKTLPGYIRLKNIRGVVIDMCRFRPAYEELGTDPMTFQVNHRPTSIIDIAGARTYGTLRIAPPAPTDMLWPAGAPEDSPTGPPTDAYTTITNKKEQLAIFLTDPTTDAVATRFHRLGGLFSDKLVFLGQTEQAGSIVVPKTTMTTVIDVLKARNYVSLSGDATWTFSNDTPEDGTVCAVEVKASGADRTVTLPASVADATSGTTVSGFIVRQNKRHLVTFLYLNANWLVGGYPYDEWAVLAASTSYADDAAAAAGGVAVGGVYRTGSAVKVRVS